VLAPFRFNHPIRIAERAAYLDHLRGGRLEAFLKTVAEQEALLEDPAGGELTGQFLRDQAAKGIAPPNQAQIIIGRIMQGETVADDEVFNTLSVQDPLIVGSPETCRRKMRIFEDLGIDRLMCFHQVGSLPHLPHDKVMKSIRLVGRHPDRRDQEPGQRSLT
jgi:alkanesulfonate monooxygenase SsuD/methylene tetrahydromethanopterin reductase-like flavin-dependent oxidoreductase (luciferase family)